MIVEVQHDYLLKNLTAFKIGGCAKNFYLPKNIEELIYLLENLENYLVMGNWSNALVSSLGIEENVISTKYLCDTNIDNKRIYAQCGIKGPMLSKMAMENGLSGFEFMSGFPGSLGGNVYMNASANGQAVSDYLVSAQVFDVEKKEVLNYKKDELDFSYRSSLLQRKPLILMSAEFELQEKNVDEIKKTVDEILEFRRVHQPNLSIPNAGSIFRNPENNSAGALLDKAGAKNFSAGGAKVWEHHANFVVNPNQNATSQDVLELMLKMYNAVKEKFGIMLIPEVKFFGKKNKREGEICNILYNQK